MNHWHCGHIGNGLKHFNFGWDFSDWALPVRFCWDSVVVIFYIGPMELRYNRLAGRAELKKGKP